MNKMETRDGAQIIGSLKTVYYLGLSYEVKEIAVAGLEVVSEQGRLYIARKDGKHFGREGVCTVHPAFFFGSLSNAQESAKADLIKRLADLENEIEVRQNEHRRLEISFAKLTQEMAPYLKNTSEKKPGVLGGVRY